MNINLNSLSTEKRQLLQAIGVTTGNSLEVPGDFLQTMLEYGLERAYLNGLSEVTQFPSTRAISRMPISWLSVERLPIHPGAAKDFALLPRWQSVLSTLHSWQHRLVFLLLRHKSQTHLYLGAVPSTGEVNAHDCAGQLSQAAYSQMPGIELQHLSKDAGVSQIIEPMYNMTECAVVTGLPSLRKGNEQGLMQTLDQIAFGVRDRENEERDYALVVIADPVSDTEISANIHRLRKLGAEFHSLAKRTRTSGDSSGSSQTQSTNLGAIVGGLTTTVLGLVPALTPFVAPLAGIFWGLSSSKTSSDGVSSSETTQYLDKVAEYCEQLTDQHINRLKQGRNLGFWNTGIYLLADSTATNRTLAGMLRAVYSGDQTFLEPVRGHILSSDSNAVGIVKQFQQLSLPHGQGAADPGESWHPLGRLYETVTTPMNTLELSLATSFPRREVPGLKFNRTDVRFATNPHAMTQDSPVIKLGEILDQGVPVGMPYSLQINALLRHALLTGNTGQGKSTACRNLIQSVIRQGIPTLIVEPAKDEYIRWGLEYNQTSSPEKRMNLFMPGAEQLDGIVLDQLCMNPFEPAGLPGGSRDFALRYERLCAILSASMPMTDILPTLLEESIYRHLELFLGPGFTDREMDGREEYPTLQSLAQQISIVVGSRGYDTKTRETLVAALNTRLQYLSRGKRGKVLNARKSTSPSVLFEQPTIVNLSQLADDRDKSLFMSLLLMSLAEYRIARYRQDSAYRTRANGNQLCHLTMVEEAHRLLRKPEQDLAGVGSPQSVAATMFSDMLSEYRAYGQGLLVVDQFPSRIIPEAIKLTGTKIVFRTGARDDRAALAACMSMRPDQEELMSALRIGEAIVASDLDDGAMWLRMLR